MGWGSRVVGVARALEERFDRFRFEFKRRFGLLEPFEISCYRGHGTRRQLYLKGRVLEETGVSRSGRDHTPWVNLRNMARRFASSEVAGARVRARLGELLIEAVADEEGFFDVRLELPEPLEGETAWHAVEVELISPGSPGGGAVRSTGRVLVPGEAEFGVISDLDDTVVRSNATSVLKMAWIVLLNNAHTRLPFEGVAEFYEALRRGPGGRSRNPVFYVSSSPWNIYDVLEDFLDVHGVPAGPLFLKDWSPTVLGKHRDHKLGIIRTLLRTYPDLPFVLIGDSGEKDPEIYAQIVREHPGRIRAIYIRDVTTRERDAEVHAIASALRGLGTQMVLTGDTAGVAEHASHTGLIAPEAVPGIRVRGGART
ncbi:MAG TPA: phosphatase domain-containing protein [Rubrobacteraceae bacterium]|nr:phosphatase domain-containing protein [Rubrobacteraceae bacterium]